MEIKKIVPNFLDGTQEHHICMTAGRIVFIDLEEKINSILLQLQHDYYHIMVMIQAIEDINLDLVNSFDIEDVDYPLLIDVVCNPERFTDEL